MKIAAEQHRGSRSKRETFLISNRGGMHSTDWRASCRLRSSEIEKWLPQCPGGKIGKKQHLTSQRRRHISNGDVVRSSSAPNPPPPSCCHCEASGVSAISCIRMVIVIVNYGSIDRTKKLSQQNWQMQWHPIKAMSLSYGYGMIWVFNASVLHTFNFIQFKTQIKANT